MAYDHPSHRVFGLRSGELHAYGVEPHHLDTGTGTSQGTRDFANDRIPGAVAPAPAAEWDARWAVGGQGGSGRVANPPPAPGGVWHAGHTLARQNGGLGHDPADIRPQHGGANAGNTVGGVQTYQQWRGQEQAFHNEVRDQQAPGAWTAMLRQQPYVAPDPALVPAVDPVFDPWVQGYDEAADPDWHPG